MKSIVYLRISAFILTGMLLVMLYSCKKDNSSGSTSGKSTAIFNPASTYGTMTDQEGNTYKTIQIGSQVWMAENLKVTKYRNGDLIGTTSPSTLPLTGAGSSSYEWAGMNDENQVATYGRLYTWLAVTDTRNIAPTGWHVPSTAEWTALTDYLGGGNVAGGKLKETGTTHWLTTNYGATNESGFTALPSGLRDAGGLFYTDGQYASWWTSTEQPPSNAWYAYVGGVSTTVVLLDSYKSEGYAVRCVKD